MAFKLVNKIDEYYSVSDQWYPNYPNDMVRMRVTFYEYDNKPQDMVRISFWGYDDFGLEKDEFFSRKDYHDKWKQIKRWIETIPEPLNQKWLYEQGFINA